MHPISKRGLYEEIRYVSQNPMKFPGFFPGQFLDMVDTL